ARNLAYVGTDGARVRINPGSTTRLMVVPRPMHATHPAPASALGEVPAAFVDLALHALPNAEKLRQRQGAIYLYLRGVKGSDAAALWNALFAHIEQYTRLPRGTFRATVMLDNLLAAVEADAILHALRHRSA